METMAVEYGVEHLGMSMDASTLDVLGVALSSPYKAKLFGRGFANLVLDKTKYVGTGRAGTSRAYIRQDMLGRADAYEHVGLWMAHEADVPPRDAFLTRLGDSWGDALDWV